MNMDNYKCLGSAQSNSSPIQLSQLSALYKRLPALYPSFQLHVPPYFFKSAKTKVLEKDFTTYRLLLVILHQHFHRLSVQPPPHLHPLHF
jgi:hypothetical protein